MLELNLPSPLEKINYALFEKHEIEVFLKRDDLIHTEISGNKWRKLKLNIEKFKHGKYDALLTFGGAYSNHISATAAVGNQLSIPTIGIIRGDELNADSNETLREAKKHGMQLEFISREEYSWRYEVDYKNELRSKFGNVLVIEEGGANFYGMMGCTEIVSEINQKVDYYILPVGTGTTAAGILMAENIAKIIAVPALANGEFLREEILELLKYGGLNEDDLEEKNKQLILPTEFSFGGYGKWNDELIDFMNYFYESTKIKLDQVYTAKAMFALCELIKSGVIPSKSRVIAIHTGGLQGIKSIQSQLNFSY